MDAETKARFEDFEKRDAAQSKRFDKLDGSLSKIYGLITDVRLEMAARNSWNTIGKGAVMSVILGVIGTIFYLIKLKLGA